MLDRVLRRVHIAAAVAVPGFFAWREAHHQPWGWGFSLAIISLCVLGLIRKHLSKAHQRSLNQLREPFL